MTSNDKGTQKLTPSDANFLAMLWKSGATFEQGVTLPSGLRMTSEEIHRFTSNEGWK